MSSQVLQLGGLPLRTAVAATRAAAAATPAHLAATATSAHLAAR